MHFGFLFNKFFVKNGLLVIFDHFCSLNCILEISHIFLHKWGHFGNVIIELKSKIGYERHPTNLL